MSWNEVTELVERAQTGDRAAYGELVERFQPAVYAVALARLRNPTEAQELTQEVFLHAMTKLPQLRDPHCFAGWLRQITVRMAINRVTRRGPLQKVESGGAAERAEAAGAARWTRWSAPSSAERAVKGAGAAEAGRPGHAGGVLHPRPVPEADEPRVRDAGRHHQAARDAANWLKKELVRLGTEVEVAGGRRRRAGGWSNADLCRGRALSRPGRRSPPGMTWAGWRAVCS